MIPTPKKAMVLSAGLGTRMRPLTNKMPKPLVEVGGKALIDHVLDRLAEAGVERAVVNMHHFAEQIERHLASRAKPRIVISDERGLLLGTGGAVVKALPELGPAPFVHAGAAILAPALFKGAPQGEFPLTDLFDRAAEAGRLHGLRLEGLWMHVGTPDAIASAERAIRASTG